MVPKAWVGSKKPACSSVSMSRSCFLRKPIHALRNVWRKLLKLIPYSFIIQKVLKLCVLISLCVLKSSWKRDKTRKEFSDSNTNNRQQQSKATWIEPWHVNLCWLCCQKVCEKCEGYGVQQCHVCQGRGVLTWEGKLRHTDPCPLCFGSCLKRWLSSLLVLSLTDLWWEGFALQI